MSGIMQGADLLPKTYEIRRKQNRSLALISVGGVLVLGLIVFWWISLGARVSDEERKLAEVQTVNADLQQQVAELQPFAALETEVLAKTEALRTVMMGDIYWPSVLTEVAAIIPDGIWLDTFNASAGTVEGSAPVGTEGAEIRVSPDVPTGRIQFTGGALSMRAVSDWLTELNRDIKFAAGWLNGASRDIGSTDQVQVIRFDSTAEMGVDALSQRFQVGL